MELTLTVTVNVADEGEAYKMFEAVYSGRAGRILASAILDGDLLGAGERNVPQPRDPVRDSSVSAPLTRVERKTPVAAVKQKVENTPSEQPRKSGIAGGRRLRRE